MTTWLTPHEVAELLKISYEKALSFVKYSGVPYVKIGKQYRVSEIALTNFLSKTTEVKLE